MPGLLVSLVLGALVAPPVSESRAADLRPLFVAQSKSGTLASDIGEGRRFGVGLALGNPLVFTGRRFVSPRLAFTASAGLLLHSHTGYVAGLDVTYHFRDLLSDNPDLEFSAYVGGGLGSGVWKRSSYHHHSEPWSHYHRHELTEFLLYGRPVAGVAVMLRPVPLEVFAELAPLLRVVHEVGFDFGGGVGARYYF